MLDFYTKQGVRTEVEKGTFDDFPDDIADICEVLRGLGVHPAHLDVYGLDFSSERIGDRDLKTIQEVVDKIRELKDDSLLKAREPKDRIVIICRHFAMLLVSVLREKGIPARCRCGFATYFSNGRFEDHWLCEYWNEKEGRWLRVDPQMDKVRAEEKGITFLDFTDVLKDVFFPAGVLWKLYRQDLISGDFCGYSPEGGGEEGAWYIRGNMLRDFFALNKVEYTYGELNKLMDRDYEPNEEELLLLDKIADLTINVDENFDELVAFYESNESLTP